MAKCTIFLCDPPVESAGRFRLLLSFSRLIHVPERKNIREKISYAQSYPHYPHFSPGKSGFFPFPGKNNRFVDYDKTDPAGLKTKNRLDISIVNKLNSFVLIFRKIQTIVPANRSCYDIKKQILKASLSHSITASGS